MDYLNNSKHYRIVSNGLKYRIQFEFFITGESGKDYIQTWPFIAEIYIVVESYGIRSEKPFEFNSIEGAQNYIHRQFGSIGLDKLTDTWIPVCSEVKYE